ncbi:MAG: hypothetical protein LBN39_09930 [Planctomycetaceae bacterium]|jgi:flagellar assembly protein FliH|nr:hypothetical protein [Planctomycetaceae bacterium]
MPLPQTINYRPVPFNFIDLEEKAAEYLARVKADAVQVAAQARNEVARLRDTSRQEIETARTQAAEEAEKIRIELRTLNQKLKTEEENYKKRNAQLESDAIKLKAELKKNEDTARKNGYDEGYKVGYDEGTTKGYADGELQAAIDYAEKIRNEAAVQLGTKLETLFPAMQSMLGQLETAKQSFLQLWEQSAVQVAASIAERAVARNLPEMVDVPLKLLREALELGAGSTAIKVRLNPDDYETLQPQMDLVVNQMCGTAKTEIVPDGRITPGGCVLETAMGVIDNQIESRIERMMQELVQTD